MSKAWRIIVMLASVAALVAVGAPLAVAGGGHHSLPVRKDARNDARDLAGDWSDGTADKSDGRQDALDQQQDATNRPSAAEESQEATDAQSEASDQAAEVSNEQAENNDQQSEATTDESAGDGAQEQADDNQLAADQQQLRRDDQNKQDANAVAARLALTLSSSTFGGSARIATGTNCHLAWNCQPSPSTTLTPPSFSVSSPSFSVSSPSFSVSYGGMDYTQPNHSFTGCDLYLWLTPSCYANSTLTSFGISPQQQLSSDMNWITAHHMGGFQRIWISLDELFSCWNSITGFCGYSSQALANLDDALARIAAAHQKVDLVLLADDSQLGFHFEALDGYHAQMRQGYLVAVQQFVQHVAANSTDASVIAVMDLENEAYLQNWKHLKNMPNICGTSWRCINENITHPWLADLYNTAHGAAPGFNYTVSDTAHLLDTTQQSYWLNMYPVDVYDIHLYSGDPWDPTPMIHGNLRAQFSLAANFSKPWFVGEAGCFTNGNTLCSYDGGNINCSAPTACSLSVDSWFLSNLRSYGASAVLVQNGGTCIAYPHGASSQTASLLGQQVIATLN